ncbi:DUF7354 domain-containing protein [Magnetococcales bacterium HHB-1]
MRKYILSSFALLMAFVMVSWSSQALAKAPPVAFLMQVKGGITYTKNNVKWKKIRRNKFLFAGVTVKTSANGSGQIVNQSKNTVQDLGPNSVVKITEQGIEKVSGTLSEPRPAEGDLFKGLKNRFTKSQRYTTIRRNVRKKEAVKLVTSRKITLASAYPELVWENQGKQYSYRLVIDGKTKIIPASAESVIRIPIKNLEPGVHKYRVEVLEGDRVVYKPRKDGEIRWLSRTEYNRYEAGIRAVRTASNGDDFLLAGYMEERGLLVPAMDLYRKYFEENPDDNDMRPMLIKAYNDLKLKKLRREEALRYNEILSSDG